MALVISVDHLLVHVEHVLADALGGQVLFFASRLRGFEVRQNGKCNGSGHCVLSGRHLLRRSVMVVRSGSHDRCGQQEVAEHFVKRLRLLCVPELSEFSFGVEVGEDARSCLSECHFAQGPL